MEYVIIIVLAAISVVEGLFLKEVTRKYRRKKLKEQLLEEIIQEGFKNRGKDINCRELRYSNGTNEGMHR